MEYRYQAAFASGELIAFSMVAVVVFAIFNFREKARCFAGDVGSISIAFIIIFLVGSLMLATQNLVYIVLLGVYGVDSVLTIVHRLLRRENIFEAHRSHLYQVMANEGGLSHITVSCLYMALQAILCVQVVWITEWPVSFQAFYVISVLLSLAVGYVFVKWLFLKSDRRLN